MACWVHQTHSSPFASNFSPQTRVSQGIPQWKSVLPILNAEKIAVHCLADEPKWDWQTEGLARWTWSSVCGQTQESAFKASRLSNDTSISHLHSCNNIVDCRRTFRGFGLGRPQDLCMGSEVKMVLVFVCSSTPQSNRSTLKICNPAHPLQESPGPSGPGLPKEFPKSLPGPEGPGLQKVSENNLRVYFETLETVSRTVVGHFSDPEAGRPWETLWRLFPDSGPRGPGRLLLQ